MCVTGSTAIDALRVAVGSTLGAFIALGVVVGFVLLAKCQSRRGAGGRSGRRDHHRRYRGVIDDAGGGRHGGRHRLVSTESDEVSLDDDESYNVDDDDVYDEKFAVDSGDKFSKATTMVTTFGDLKCAGPSRVSTSLVGPRMWPIQKTPNLLVAAGSSDMASSHGIGSRSIVGELSDGRRVQLFPFIDQSAVGLSSSCPQHCQPTVTSDTVVAWDGDVDSRRNGNSINGGTTCIDVVKGAGSRMLQGPAKGGERLIVRLPPPTFRVLLVTDCDGAVSRSDDENGTDGGRICAPTDAAPSVYGRQPHRTTSSVSGSTSRDKRTVTNDRHANEVRAERAEDVRQNLLRLPVQARNVPGASSSLGRSFPDLPAAFDTTQQNDAVWHQQRRHNEATSPATVAAESSADAHRSLTSYDNASPSFLAYQLEADDAEIGSGRHGDTVQLLAADDYQQQPQRTTMGSLRQNHSSIW
jgi:hypothetical protein